MNYKFKIREQLFVILSNIITIYSLMEYNPDINNHGNSQLEIRAVIIKCEINENPEMLLDGASRFQREELFKHNALRNCKQKLAVTIKTSSIPNQVSGDEYIPIEHVLDRNNKKIRLLNPYVLRLRRNLPFQTYRLHRIDTVTGIIMKSYDKKRAVFNESKFIGNSPRRSINVDDFPDKSAEDFIQDGSVRNEVNSKGCYKTLLGNYNEKYELENKNIPSKPSFELDLNKNDYPVDLKEDKFSNEYLNNQEIREVEFNINNINKNGKETRLFTIDHSSYPIYNSDSYKFNGSREMNTKQYFKKDIKKGNMLGHSDIKDEEHELALYEIGDPDLWYTARVQLFEKLTSPEGKTLWNDLTKGGIASVSTRIPEWSNQDVNVKYTPIEWLPRDDFALPLQNLSLVVPIKAVDVNFSKATYDDLIIVPTDDIITLNVQKEIYKRNENIFDSNQYNGQTRRKVAVRMARALIGGNFNNLRITSRGSDHYLKLPHMKQYNTQIDVEARADDNELVLVGIHGRLTTIVSDSTRRARSLLSVQATNMGLAGARFRALIRKCTPDLKETVNERDESTKADLILIPPKHTRSFRLGLPLTTPVDSVHCIVALENENDEAVAVRDVRIKRDDRCFCVWHCDCVCLSEDPKLLCRALTDAQIIAAGLSTNSKSRHIRSVCYPDVVTLNLFVMFIGVLLALLLLGIIKACIGLLFRCVGSWGLQLLLQTPRKLNQYYESSLRSRPVMYDKEGWPIHPDTKQRSVRLISKPMEFVLNLIFFITLPCILFCDAIKKIISRCHAPERKMYRKYRKSETKKCFSSHDVQNITPRNRQHCRDLQRWMSPQAEELSTDIWQEDLRMQGKIPSDCLQPLLRERKCYKKINNQSSCRDPEQDDTEYILMQMQKSKESLAKSQRILETSSNIKKYSASNE